MDHLDTLIEFVVDDGSVEWLVLYSSGMHSLSEPSYFEYFTGVSPVGDRNCLVLSPSGEAAIVLDLPRDVDRTSRYAAVDDVRGSEAFVEELQTTLSDLEVEGSLGVAGVAMMPAEVYEGLEAVAAEIERVDDDVAALKTGKTDRELELFRELGRIADHGFDALYEAIRPGLKEYEVAAELERAMRLAGAEDNFNLYGSYPHNDLLHSPREKVLEQGDTFLCEISPMLEGYVLQITRTIVVGTPRPVVSEKFALLEEALDATKDRLEVGVEAAVISRTMNDVFRREGYEGYCQPPYMRTRGHEFGFGPIGMAITEETETPLTEDMVLVIHPNQYIPETGYLALGDPVLITTHGAETLVETPARLFTKEVVR